MINSMLYPANFRQHKKHNPPQFGRDALFERHLPFAKARITYNQKRTPLEKLKSQGASVKELANAIAERAYEDHYENTRRMANRTENLAAILSEAKREARLRANVERNAKLDRTTIKPFTGNLEMPDAKNGFVLNKKPLPYSPVTEAEIRQQKSQTVIAQYIKPGLAKLAQGTESPSQNRSALSQLAKGEKLLGQLGYLGKKNKSMEPVVIHAQANLGTATFDHGVRAANLMAYGSEMSAAMDKSFEGMAIAFPYRTDPSFHKKKAKYIKRMDQELEYLERAVDNTQSINTPVKGGDFVLANLYNRQAEVEHALAHYNSNPLAFRRYGQNARKAIRAANEAYQKIPLDQRTEEHARFAYNLNKKANHLCDRHDQHSPLTTTRRARELCRIIKEDMPANISTMKKFSGFDPTYGLTTKLERFKIFD